MVIESTRKGNSVYDEMKSRAFALYITERQSAYETYTADDELNDILENSEDDYNFNLYKLDDLVSLSKMNESLIKKFIAQKMYIEQMDISEKNKVESILTSACIFKNFGVFLVNRDTSEEVIYLLTQAMMGVKPSEYSLYQTLIMYNFDNLVRLLRNFDNSKITCAKQYVKTENN